MSQKKIIVTGGTGYIGSHTVVELINRGYDVIVLDNLSTSRREVLDSIESITGIKPLFAEIDLRDREAVKRFIHETPFDAIIHFAALKSVGESVQDPLMYYDNNVGGLINLLRSFDYTKTIRFVFSSSCTVYGDPESLPVKEILMPQQSPVSPYGNTKKISEEILLHTANSYFRNTFQPLRCISLRYFNPIGAHESALIGEYQTGIPNNLLPALTETAIGKRNYFEVFGNDYNTPDGTCIRDYIHVMDVASAHVSAIERLLSGKNNNKAFEVFNIGTGRGFSVMEVIKEFEKVSGLKLNYKIAPRRTGDAEQIYADVSLVTKELNWKASRTLNDMLGSAWKWEQKLAAAATK